MNIVVTFNDFEEMNDFAAKLNAGQGLPFSPNKEETVKKTEKPVKGNETAEKPVKKESVEEPDESKTWTDNTAEVEENQYSFTDVRAALANLSKKDPSKVKELLSEFGASKLSDVKEEDYTALMKKAGEA